MKTEVMTWMMLDKYWHVQITCLDGVGAPGTPQLKGVV